MKLTPTQERIMNYTTKGMSYTYSEIANLISMNVTNLNKQFKPLIEKGFFLKLNTRPVRVRKLVSYDQNTNYKELTKKSEFQLPPPLDIKEFNPVQDELDSSIKIGMEELRFFYKLITGKTDRKKNERELRDEIAFLLTKDL